MNRIVVIHPVTTHETRRVTPLYDGVPREVNIRLAPNSAYARTEWYAHVLPVGHECTEGDDCVIACGWLTSGNSPAKALNMAYELMSLYWDECRADITGNTPHCWCQDTVYSLPESDEHTQFLKCCRCDAMAAATEVEQ